MTNDATATKLRDSLERIQQWVEDHDYRGFEPFDGLSSCLRHLTFGNLLLERILMQAVRQCPLNLRPLLGIKPLDSTIGRGYMAWGYVVMFEATGEEAYSRKARQCLGWLIENKSPGYEEFSWGKHFDFASRGGVYSRFEPTTIWTGLIGLAFLRAYEVLNEERYLEVADSICRWILGLSRAEHATGTSISYTGSGAPSSIHNHAMMAAAMLARTGAHRYNPEYLRLARSIMSHSCSRQLPDGAWYYGEEEKFHWIDNFHTGYNLDSLLY